MSTKKIYSGLFIFALLAVLAVLFADKNKKQDSALSLPAAISFGEDSAKTAQEIPADSVETNRAADVSNVSEDVTNPPPTVLDDTHQERLIQSGPAAGFRLRIPKPDEYAGDLTVKVKTVWKAYQSRYSGADPTDTEALHATIMKERERYPVLLTQGFWF